MNRKKRFFIGGVIVLATLGYLIYGGMRQAMVYFVTPSELKQQQKNTGDKFLRMGGMVVPGSLKQNLRNLIYSFNLTDGSESVPVYFRGIPPDLFKEGKGAVVEGRLREDGVFHATLIMAKHSEEYSPPKEGQHADARSFVPAREEGRR